MSADAEQPLSADDELDLITLAAIDLLRAFGLGPRACQQLMAERIASLWPESAPAHPTLQ